MSTIRKIFALFLMALFTTSCSTTQSRYSMLGDAPPLKSKSYDIQLFQHEIPERSFVRISRLDVHIEKTHFIAPSFDDALPELKKQARLSGADAIIDINESRSWVGETRIYHVTATGIRFNDSR